MKKNEFFNRLRRVEETLAMLPDGWRVSDTFFTAKSGEPQIQVLVSYSEFSKFAKIIGKEVLFEDYVDPYVRVVIRLDNGVELLKLIDAVEVREARDNA